MQALPLTLLLIASGAALGANARFLVGSWVVQMWPVTFPLATLLINCSGSFALGLLSGWPAFQQLWHGRWWVMLGVGFLGSYTTFSTFSVETFRLWQMGSPAQALLYASLSPAVGAGLAALGFGLSQGLL